jgi:predicted DsbA family dithiol-disulfide isomerase
VEGRSLEDLFAGRPVNIPEMLERMRQVARAEGLAFGDRRMTYNSRLAQELGKWAEFSGRGEPFHHAAFVAYFAEGKNIALPEVLVETALAAGLPAEEAREVIDGRRFQAAVDRDWERSRRLGVTAVPTFMIDGQRLVGAQPYEAMERLVAEAGAPKK